MESLFEKYVIQGGPMMVLLLPCSILALAAILHGMIRLRRGRVIPGEVLHQVRQVHDSQSRGDCLEQLRLHDSPLAQAIWWTLRSCDPTAGRPDRRRIEPALDEAMARVGDRMHDGLGVLSTLYTIAPLMGLMGTILGMMNTFYDFGVRQEKSVQILSIGIQEALVTTLWGLAIAIVAFVGAMRAQARIRRYEQEHLPAAVLEAIEALWPGSGGEDRVAEEAETVSENGPAGAVGEPLV